MISRIVADAVFLTRLGTLALPPMLVFSALVVGGISFLWARRTKDLPLSGLVLGTQLSGAAATALLLVMMQVWPQSMAVVCAIYVLAELRGCFNSIQLAVLLNENFCSRSEQRKFAFVNAGSPVAGIIVGTLPGIVSMTTHDVRILFVVLTAARGCQVIRWGIHQVGVQILYGTLPTIVNAQFAGHPPMIWQVADEPASRQQQEMRLKHHRT